MARVITEFEMSKIIESTSMYHEQTKHVQKAFCIGVQSLVQTIDPLGMGKTFNDIQKDMLVLNTRDTMEPSVVEVVWKIEELGTAQFKMFVKERLTDQTKPIRDPIKRNNLPLFSRPSLKLKSTDKQKVTSLKNDCSLFSRLYISAQVWAGDLDTFFQHENQTYPPSQPIPHPCFSLVSYVLVTSQIL